MDEIRTRVIININPRVGGRFLRYVAYFIGYEIFTSKIAEENLIKAGVKDIKKIIDQEAARIILESYLEKGNKE